LSDLERQGLLSDGETWMEMIKSRNESSHTYNLEIAERIAASVIEKYWKLFVEFREWMDKKEEEL
jgi:hypothetical protein